jgi:hypothetical protein
MLLQPALVPHEHVRHGIVMRRAKNRPEICDKQAAT